MPIQIAIAAGSYIAGEIIRGATTPDGPSQYFAPVQPPQPVRAAENIDRTTQNIDVRPPDPLGVAPEAGGAQIGIFGRRRVGGRVVLSARDTGNIDWLVIVLAGAPVGAVYGIYLNNVFTLRDASGFITTPPFNLSCIKITLYDGTQTSRDAALDTAFPGWTADFIGLKCAYAVVRINKAANAAAFAAGMPMLTFDVGGHACYDPRDPSQDAHTPASWQPSSNAAVINAAYLTHELGAGVPVSAIDWASVAAAADICDQPVALQAGGTEPRYTAALIWRTDERHEAVLTRIGRAYDGGMHLVGTKYRCDLGFYTELPPDAAHITPDDYVEDGISWSDATEIAEYSNAVRGTFTSPAHGFELRDFPVYRDAAAIAAFGGREMWLDLDLECVTSHTQAQRLARIAVLRAQLGWGATVAGKFSLFDTTAGDLVSLTDPLAGFDALPFRVLADALSPDMSVTLTLQHEPSAVFAWTAELAQDLTIAPSIYGVVSFGSAAGDTGSLSPGGGVMYDVDGVSASFQPRIAVSASPSTPAASYKVRFVYTKRITYYYPNTPEYAGSTPPAPSVTTTTQDVAESGGFATFPFPMRQQDTYGTWTSGGSSGTYLSSRTDYTLSSVQLSTYRSTTELWSTIFSGSSVNGAGLDGITQAGSTYYVLAAPCAPYVASGSGLAYTIKTNLVPGGNAAQIELWSFTTTATTGGTLVATAANIAGGTSFAVSGAAGTGKYYRMRTRSGSGVVSAYSNYLLLVYQ